MSLQIFLQGKLLGIEEFLMSPVPRDSSAHEAFAGRARYAALLTEVLPRALLAELGLAKILLGSSGGGQFLVVLPMEARLQAEDFLAAAAKDTAQLSGNALQLVWAVTENLGDWSVVRRRLHEEMHRKRGTPAAGLDAGLFLPFGEDAVEPAKSIATIPFVQELLAAESAGWSPDGPGRILAGRGKYTWPLSSGLSPDAIPIARHAALGDA